MPISSLLRCGQVLVHKPTLLQSQTSEREAGVGAERDDTDAIATTIAAEAVREDTRDGHVREMVTGTDDTDTDETIATADTTRQSLGSITVVASAQGRDLGSAGDIGVARRGTEERGMVTGAGVMTELQHQHNDKTTDETSLWTEKDQVNNKLHLEALIRVGNVHLKSMLLHKNAQLFRLWHEEDAASLTVYPRLSPNDVYSFSDTK